LIVSTVISKFRPFFAYLLKTYFLIFKIKINMKKIFFMFAFAGIATFSASAQTEATASKTAKADKKECTRTCTTEEKASCEKMAGGAKACCASGKASTTAMAAKTEKATTASNKKATATTGNK
jgi:hypothetical protein